MNIEKEIKKFLDGICIDFGFCLPPDDIRNLVSMDRFEADKFVRDIFVIEGVNPDVELHLFRKIKRRFSDHFGGSEIQK